MPIKFDARLISGETTALCLLLVLTGWLFGYRLGALGFWNKHTESRRAEVAREMVVSGDWVVPHLNGKVFPTKPPLAYWLMALSFRWTDRVDEWAARLPSAICGWLTVFVTYGIGRRLWGSGAGLFSGTFLATGVLFQWYARSAGLDMVLTCATTLTLWCFINSQVIETQRQSRWMILGGVFLALATLTKGPLGLSVPLLPIAGWLVLGGRQRHPSRFKTWLWALLAFAVVLVPWCVSILQRAPNIFEVASQEIRENIVRPLTSQYQHGSHHEPWYYYLGTLGAFAPWSLFLPAALWEWGSAVRARAQRPMDSGLLFVWLWFGLNLIVFSLAPQKKPYYFLPCLPAVALLVGKCWADRRGKAVGLLAPLWLLLGVFLIGGLAFVTQSGRFFPSATARWVAGVGVLLVLGSGLAAWLLIRDRLTAVVPAFIGMLCVLHLIGMTAMLPLDDQYRSRKSFFHTVADIAHEQPVYAYHYGGYDAPFYLQRIVPFLESPETLQATLNRPERCFVIIPEQAYVEHPAHGMVTVLDQTWIAPAGFHGRQRLLLVSNQ